MDILSIYDGHIVVILWRYHGHIMDISWTYCGYIMEISWTYCGNMMDILWLNETRRLSLLEQLFTTGFKSHDPHAHFSQIGLAAT